MTDRQDINIDALRKALLERKAELEWISALSAESREFGFLRHFLLHQRVLPWKPPLPRLVKLDSCDEPIAAKRLELDPAITVCIGCAK